jgi:hypothetical protein
VDVALAPASSRQREEHSSIDVHQSTFCLVRNWLEKQVGERRLPIRGRGVRLLAGVFGKFAVTRRLSVLSVAADPGGT